MKKAVMVLALCCVAAAVWAVDAPAPVAKKVTISASKQPVRDVLKQVAKDTGETILVEKLVTGDATAEIRDVTAEDALDAIAKSNKLEWRAVYVADGSILARDADVLAAQMRTVLSVKFPDIVISEAGSGGSFVHVQRESAAKDIITALPASAGFRKVYLVTDDEKAYKKDLRDEEKKKVSKYVEGQRAQLQSFLDMDPEERKQALNESINLTAQMGPKVMADMIATVFESDPDFIAKQSKMQMEALMNMDAEARGKIIRLSIRSNIEAMKSMPPELMEQFRQEAIAAAQEAPGTGEPAP